MQNAGECSQGSWFVPDVHYIYNAQSSYLAANLRRSVEPWRMGRLLFLLAVVIIVYLLLKSYRKQVPKQDVSASAEEMVRCAQCGVHLPKSESTLVSGNYYCCDAHRREHTSK